MIICIPSELSPGETRCAMTPANAARLVKLGVDIQIESAAARASGDADSEFLGAGAKVFPDRKAALPNADVVLRVRKPPLEEVDWLKPGAVHVSFLDPFNEPELIAKLAARGVSAVSLEMLPRITRAQKMDALSSQANLAGYVAVILAAEHSPKIFPMMMTAAGTISPVRVFIIGAGVAGLQAIATARRLGARVEAYDTRPTVEEQVKSLGAKFLKIDLGKTGQTQEGYAMALTEEQLQAQRAAMKKFCGDADVVITTAQVFGRKAPILVTAAMLDAMKPGSVVVDLAVESGGNVAGVTPGQITDHNGVKLLGLTNLPGRVPVPASQVYSTNLVSFIEEFWDKQNKKFVLNLDDEIIKGCLVTHGGKVINEKLAQNK
jgi:H+-translocating NAD(P) transhydrogenase subunit alpha